MSRAGLLAIAAVALGLASGRAAAAPHTQVHWVMGTWLRITLDDDHGDEALAACFRDARALDRVFSRWDPDSELERLRRAAEEGPVEVSPEMAALTARALALRAATEGAFDPAIGALTALHREDPAPSATALAAARAASGAGAATLEGQRLRLRAGARLDFDGIAKGWAVDRCVERLRAAGVRRALVSLGESSIAAIGAPAGADAWTLEVRGTDPDTSVGTLRLRDAALSVSATHGGPGAGRAHIVDPSTGRLVEETAVGVVVADSATDAEAWSKALLVWGASGPERVESLGARGALRVTAAGVRAGARLAEAASFVPLDQPRQLAAGEEPLR